MKRFSIALISALCISSFCYAAKEYVYSLSYPDMMYMYWNDADKTQEFRLFVEEKHEGKPADQVTLVCNGNDIQATTGSWTKCDVNPHKPISFLIRKENFKNGANGVSSRWY